MEWKWAPYLEVGVVVVGVLGLPDLDGHAWLLHELAGGEGQAAQHALATALQYPLEDLGTRTQRRRGTTAHSTVNTLIILLMDNMQSIFEISFAIVGFLAFFYIRIRIK